MKFLHKCVICSTEATKKCHGMFVCDRCAKALRHRYRQKPAKRPRFALKEFYVHTIETSFGNMPIYGLQRVRLR